jgi:tetratricopeptide (TPR) repeat protein
MNPFDELPRRAQNHKIEDDALTAFQKRLVESGCFILQASDRKDYGTDCQVEVVAGGRATNVRVHVQLKGTERALNADGSVSIAVERTNLNYMLMQPYSFYACYHLPTDSLRICLADGVLRQYEHDGRVWTEQQSVTISFREEMTFGRLCQVAELARSGARSARDRRIAQTSASPADLPRTILDSVPEVYVPEDPRRAAELLRQLYDTNADDVISASFDRFAAALGANHDFMGIAYMSEINLGMARRSQLPQRIEDAIAFFQSRLSAEGHMAGSLHYTIGNAYSAIPDDEKAKIAFQAALADPALLAVPDLAAQVHKNLGTSFERLGDHDAAVEHYREALQFNPNLPEAHNAMGNHFVRIGRYHDALSHFDQVVFEDRNQGRTTAVSGWRANVLFNLGDGRAAFREITGLVGQADRERWIWSWCARLVGSFGRTTLDNAIQARIFWQRYVQARPDHSQGWWELLMSAFYLRGQGHDIGRTYAAFKEEFDLQIAHVDDGVAALPWDRLGHWAQEDEDWTEAERCFRKAYDLEGGDYGFCLGCALNHLDRYEESLPLLLEQAQSIQPDAMSWFHVAVAYIGLGRPAEAIDAYERALALDPNHALAMFDLGGTYWNLGDREKALEVWSKACEQFPEDENVGRVMAMLG